MAATVIRARNLQFAYDSDHAVLNGLDLEVQAGDFVTLIGANGSGKSTLLNIVLSQLTDYQGDLELFGDNIKQNRHFADIAYISQNSFVAYRNFPTTVREVLQVHLAYLKKQQDIVKCLQEVCLAEHANKRLSELSGGQLQRLALLLALIKEAKLIILDEPTAAIDRNFAREMMQLLRNIADTGNTILLVTHNLADVDGYADYVYELEGGKLKLQTETKTAEQEKVRC